MRPYALISPAQVEPQFKKIAKVLNLAVQIEYQCSASRTSSSDTGQMKNLQSIASVALLSLIAFANAQALESTQKPSLASIEKIVSYTDKGYGFQLAVPENWSHLYAAVDDAKTDALQPGYAVGFESPKSYPGDVFADYIMVEVLPGAHSGAFVSDDTKTQVIMVDGKVAITDKIEIAGLDINGNSIDLVVFQAEIVELGFTVGIYAIGEKREAKVLADAFELALQTFVVPEDPYSVI